MDVVLLLLLIIVNNPAPPPLSTLTTPLTTHQNIFIYSLHICDPKSWRKHFEEDFMIFGIKQSRVRLHIITHCVSEKNAWLAFSLFCHTS